MGTKNNPGKFDCFGDAAPDEPIFVLRGKDPSAPVAIEAWISDRVTIGKNLPSDERLKEAHRVANEMILYRRALDEEKMKRRAFEKELAIVIHRHLQQGWTELDEMVGKFLASMFDVYQSLNELGTKDVAAGGVVGDELLYSVTVRWKNVKQPGPVPVVDDPATAPVDDGKRVDVKPRYFFKVCGGEFSTDSDHVTYEFLRRCAVNAWPDGPEDWELCRLDPFADSESDKWIRLNPDLPVKMGSDMVFGLKPPLTVPKAPLVPSVPTPSAGLSLGEIPDRSWFMFVEKPTYAATLGPYKRLEAPSFSEDEIRVAGVGLVHKSTRVIPCDPPEHDPLMVQNR